jgi:hypothetical protein
MHAFSLGSPRRERVAQVDHGGRSHVWIPGTHLPRGRGGGPPAEQIGNLIRALCKLTGASWRP